MTPSPEPTVPGGPYEPIEVVLKETRSAAWAYVPGPRPSALSDVSMTA